MRTFLFSCFILVQQAIQAQQIADFAPVFPAAQNAMFIIPSTHQFQVLIQSGDSLSVGGTMPQRSDFTGYVPIQGSSREGHIGVNSESLDWGGGGMTILDVAFDSTQKTWQLNHSEKALIDFGAGVRTMNNCSGAVTPWGTLITCEEASFPNDANVDGYSDYGWCIEVNPVTHNVPDYDGNGVSDKLWKVGNGRHENMCFAPDHHTAYWGVDGFGGVLFKFVMTNPDDLSDGLLYALQLTDSSNGIWLPIRNDTVTACNTTWATAQAMGATQFPRIEDVEVGPDGMVYFAVTTQGIKRFNDNGNTLSDFEEYVKPRVYTQSNGADVRFEWPDNLAFDGEANLWVTQDGGDNHIWVIRANHSDAYPQVEVFANTPFGCEPTGITFTPDFRYMFLSLQHPHYQNAAIQTDASGQHIEFSRDATLVIARKEFLGTPHEPIPVYAMSVSPNPSVDGIIEVKDIPLGVAELQLIDMTGHVLRAFSTNPNRTRQTLDISDIERGVYVLRAVNPTRVIYTWVKVVKG